MSRPAYSETGRDDEPGFSREQDGRWLASRLRGQRLTILQGAKGAGKTVLLEQGVMALLRRRSGDRLVLPFAGTREGGAPLAATSSAMPRVVLPFPDRRTAVRDERRARGAEIVVAIRDWTASPLEELREALRASLPSTSDKPDGSSTLLDLASKTREATGARVLLVLDDFDECLRASLHDPAAGEFVDEWTEAVKAPDAAVHTLVAMSEPAEPLWHLLRHHCADLGNIDDHRLVLPEVATPIEAGPDAATDDDWFDSDFDPEVDDHPEPDGLAGPVDASPVSAPSVPPPVPVRILGDRSRRAAWLTAAFVLAVCVGGLIGWRMDRDRPVSADASDGALAGAEPPRPVPVGPPSLEPPGYDLWVDAGDSSDRDIVSDLARLLTPRSRSAPALHVSTGWSGQLASLAERPGLTMVTYDVLQAAKGQAPRPDLKIVTPLFSEEIYFVVRADSPLHNLRDIETATLNTGPAEGSRALTASQVYRRMFGRPPLPRQMDTAPRESGLDRLERGNVDVLVLVGAQPDPFLVGLDEERKRHLRILELDKRNPVERKALAAFLPTRVEASRGSGLEAAGGTTTLSVMTFLAASGDDAFIGEAAAALCRNLPSLQQSGHPKWRELTPGQRLDVGWPQSREATATLDHCRTSIP